MPREIVRAATVALAVIALSAGCTPTPTDSEPEDTVDDRARVDGCTGASDETTSLDVEEEAFLTLINEYRASKNVGPLSTCRSLARAAQGHSEDMRDHDYFNHIGLDGSTPFGRACDACYENGCGEPSTYMGENIAAGYADARQTFEQWKASPGHDRNMLKPEFTMIGIGRALGDETYGAHWTTLFGGDDEASCEQ